MGPTDQCDHLGHSDLVPTAFEAFFWIFLKSAVQLMPSPFYLKVMMKVDAVISLESINYVIFKLKAATPDIKVPAPPSPYYQGIPVF